MRFEKHEDCYLDTKTGLEWSLDNLGNMSWEEAIDACTKLGPDWRLPTIEELLTLIDFSKCNPATVLPKMVSSFYWSSTTSANGTNYAWRVWFYFGCADWSYKSSNCCVRTVRGKMRYLKA